MRDKPSAEVNSVISSPQPDWRLVTSESIAARSEARSGFRTASGIAAGFALVLNRLA